jgi:hypothetical protein
MYLLIHIYRESEHHTRHKPPHTLAAVPRVRDHKTLRYMARAAAIWVGWADEESAQRPTTARRAALGGDGGHEEARVPLKRQHCLRHRVEELTRVALEALAQHPPQCRGDIAPSPHFALQPRGGLLHRDCGAIGQEG